MSGPDHPEAARQLSMLERRRAKDALRSRDQLADLRHRLTETMAWCEARLASNADVSALFIGATHAPELTGNRWAVVDALAPLREPAPRLKSGGVPPGRLLVYFPDENLFDGAAQVASGGFFNVDNAPPSGTWVGYFDEGERNLSFRTYVLAWVPEMFVGAAQRGIDVNPEQCINWLKDTDVLLGDLLPLVMPDGAA